MTTDRASYTQRLLKRYCGLPDTAARRPSPYDRNLANQFFERGIGLDTIEAAFLLTIARRSQREPNAPPLPAIRSLAYFLPILEEVLCQKPDSAYLAYLAAKLDQSVQISTDRQDR
jgi:hypothetical protein